MHDVHKRFFEVFWLKTWPVAHTSNMAAVNDDPRLGTLLETIDWNADHGKQVVHAIRTTSKPQTIVLIGFPFDEGVRRNGGNPGARHGPAAFRELLPKLGTIVNPEFNHNSLANKLQIIDSGDVLVDDPTNLEAAHEKLAFRVAECMRLGAIPFVVGGGNDQSYANFCGLRDSGVVSEVSVVNIDAHLDVRPRKLGKVHSGSPFREMLEDPAYQKLQGEFVEFGAQGNQCSEAHTKYVEEKGGRIIWLLKDIRETLRSSASRVFEAQVLQEFSRKSPNRKIFVSFDVDSIQGSDCPGVSCPAVYGLTSQEALEICFHSGRNPQVVLVDASEFNPLQEKSRTARLLVTMFYFFALGVSMRSVGRSFL
jgi:formiminoglutamase